MNNNLLNKNSLIGALIILLLLTSWWGQSKTGTGKQLALDNKAAQAELVSLRAEAAEARRSRQESETALNDAEEKLRALENDKNDLAKAFSHERSAVASLKEEEKALLSKINELEYDLHAAKTEQEQTDSEQQQDLRKIAAEYKEAQTKLGGTEAKLKDTRAKLGDTEAKLQDALAKLRDTQKNLGDAQAKLKDARTRLGDAEAKLKDAQTKLGDAQAKKSRFTEKQKKFRVQTEARIARLKQQQDEATAELESLRAQVIGFEKVVEERNAALTEVRSELYACKVNTKVLLSKITEQENAQQGMEDQMRNIVQSLARDTAQEKSLAPEEKKQAADQAK